MGSGAVETSDVFSGTAQAYSILHPPPSTPAQPSGPPTTSALSGPMTSALSGPMTSALPPHMTSHLTLEAEQRVDHTHQELATTAERGRGQLEVLYGAQCRQVEVLSQHLCEAREEGERQVRILRHEKVRVCVGCVSVCVCV